MRKVTKEVCLAFLNGKTKTIGNTSTNGHSLYLHGNRIAWFVDETRKMIYLSDCGWDTVTTRDRLNGLLSLCNSSVCVFKQKGRQRIKLAYGITEWDGSPLAVLNLYGKD